MLDFGASAPPTRLTPDAYFVRQGWRQGHFLVSSGLLCSHFPILAHYIRRVESCWIYNAGSLQGSFLEARWTPRHFSASSALLCIRFQLTHSIRRVESSTTDRQGDFNSFILLQVFLCLVTLVKANRYCCLGLNSKKGRGKGDLKH